MASESHVSDQQAAKPPAQILIIRHGEKPGKPGVDGEADGPDLSRKGYERAVALAFNFPATFGKMVISKKSPSTSWITRNTRMRAS